MSRRDSEKTERLIPDKIVPEAKAVIETAEAVQVSKSDFARILELLENPPRPNDKLRAAIAVLPSPLVGEGGRATSEAES